MFLPIFKQFFQIPSFQIVLQTLKIVYNIAENSYHYLYFTLFSWSLLYFWKNILDPENGA